MGKITYSLFQCINPLTPGFIQKSLNPVDTRRRFNVDKTSIDVETTSCVYWEAAGF